MTRQYFNPSKWRTNLDTPCPALAPCVRCRELLPITSFYQVKRGRKTLVGDNRGIVCKRCGIEQYKELDPRTKLYYAAKRRARELGLDFNLSPLDIFIPTHCPAVGLELRDYTGHGRPHYEQHPDAATVDRIDNSKGYVADNIQVVSRRANLLKKDGTIQEIAGVLAYMVEHAGEDVVASQEFMDELNKLARRASLAAMRPPIP